MCEGLVALTPHFTGDELLPHKIPLLGRLYGNTRGISGQTDAFYENIKRLNQVENAAGPGKEPRGRGGLPAELVAAFNQAEWQ